MYVSLSLSTYSRVIASKYQTRHPVHRNIKPFPPADYPHEISRAPIQPTHESSVRYSLCVLHRRMFAQVTTINQANYKTSITPAVSPNSITKNHRTMDRKIVAHSSPLGSTPIENKKSSKFQLTNNCTLCAKRQAAN